MSNNNPIDPIRTLSFKLAEHSYRRFNAVVSGKLSSEQLTDPAYWPHVAPQLNEGDEVRCVADDQSFVCYLYCSFASGGAVRLKMMHGYELEEVDHDALEAQTSDLQIKQRGQQKWCIIRMSTGEVVKQGIPTQSSAQKELEEYRRALAS